MVRLSFHVHISNGCQWIFSLRTRSVTSNGSRKLGHQLPWCDCENTGECVSQSQTACWRLRGAGRGPTRESAHKVVAEFPERAEAWVLGLGVTHCHRSLLLLVRASHGPTHIQRWKNRLSIFLVAKDLHKERDEELRSFLQSTVTTKQYEFL